MSQLSGPKTVNSPKKRVLNEANENPSSHKYRKVDLQPPDLKEATETVEEFHSESTASQDVPDKMKYKLPSSENNFWLPGNLMRNSCFDDNQVLLSKEECMKNLEEAFKNKRSVDFYEAMQLSCHPEIRGTPFQNLAENVAFLLYKCNGRSSKTVDSQLDQQGLHKFDLRAANNLYQLDMLPAGKLVDFSTVYTEANAMAWSSKNLSTSIERATITILTKISNLDYYACIYCAPESTRATNYIRIPDEFFISLAKYLQRGFHIEEQDYAIAKLVTTVKSLSRNFFSRLRGNSDNTAQRLRQFKDNYDRDPFFRCNERIFGEMGSVYQENVRDGQQEPGVGTSDENIILNEYDGLEVDIEN